MAVACIRCAERACLPRKGSPGTENTAHSEFRRLAGTNGRRTFEPDVKRGLHIIDLVAGVSTGAARIGDQHHGVDTGLGIGPYRFLQVRHIGIRARITEIPKPRIAVHAFVLERLRKPAAQGGLALLRNDGQHLRIAHHHLEEEVATRYAHLNAVAVFGHADAHGIHALQGGAHGEQPGRRIDGNGRV